MTILLTFALFLPLAGFLFLALFSESISRRAVNFIAPAVILFSFLSFVSLLGMAENENLNSFTLKYYEWISLKGVQADFSLELDHLSLLMAFIITGVGFLIHVFSVGYMDHDKGYARYFAYLNLFIFAMLLLVLGKNLLVLFIGWEGVGLASYLLIGFWYEKESAAKAATKAFVMNRIGDFGLLLGILMAFYIFGTTDVDAIEAQASTMFTEGAPAITIMTLLLFVGAIGKSAQIPLLTWLPDAMEGPTPVSALIHAATMVTAGVYLIVRLDHLFLLAPFTLQVVGFIGGITSLYAAIVALGQTDLKRVLAYSTVSQLGLMFLACGAGAFYSAMFHLTTHAFVKALLFLTAGNAIHMMGGVTEMGQMGGLNKVLPKTNALFLLGVLALSGIPPFAAFFSKDLILELEYVSGHTTLFFVGLAITVLTGFYLMRAYCLSFMGPLNPNLKNVKEAPLVMLFPVAVLGVLAALGGFLGFSFGHAPLLENFLLDIGIGTEEKALASHMAFSIELVMAILGSIVGVLSALWIFSRHHIASPLWLKKGFYLNEIYDALFVTPFAKVAEGIDGRIEPRLFQGSLRGVAEAADKGSLQLQKMQSGQIRSYSAWMFLGALGVILYLFAFLRSHV